MARASSGRGSMSFAGAAALVLAPVMAAGCAGSSAANAAPGKPDDPTRVRIESGELHGAAADGVVAFKGVPFAAPPVGPLRWRAPQPAQARSGGRAPAGHGLDLRRRTGARLWQLVWAQQTH